MWEAAVGHALEYLASKRAEASAAGRQRDTLVGAGCGVGAACLLSKAKQYYDQDDLPAMAGYAISGLALGALAARKLGVI
ncbi:MAG: hypothetical protein JO089_06940 [Alphaproteobacteria bacterium]|nr:hypothetical protein [Alphaproteobacteria bacterium]